MFFQIQPFLIYTIKFFKSLLFNFCLKEGKMSWTVADAVDYKGFPADRSKTGGWVPASLVLGLLSLFLNCYQFFT